MDVFSVMNPPPELVDAFPPSPNLLLDVARRQIDEGMLLEIAQADYGNDTDLHLAELRLIGAKGKVPENLEWHPSEVLQLIRWSDPEEPTHRPGSVGKRGHQMRAFACASLLRANVADDATLAQCLVSAKAIGHEMNVAAARFLTWGTPQVTISERWLFAFGLLVVAMRIRTDRLSDFDLGVAAEWVLAEEKEKQQEFAPFDPFDPPPLPFGLSSGYWKPLAAELMVLAETIQTKDVRDIVELIGAFVLDY
jgi:hypothetical protein